MEYCVYKMKFLTGVHFGNGMLNDSEITFHADTLFSALCIEALKLNKLNDFYNYAKSGEIIISDAFPYVGKNYLLPKPIIHIDAKDVGNSIDKKKIKKLNYLPVSSLNSFLQGELKPEDIEEFDIGTFSMRTLASIRNDEEDTKPFHVGTYHFDEGNGLYVILGYQNMEALDLLEELLMQLSYTGIGGKRSSGLGKFELITAGNTDELISHVINTDNKTLMTLSVSLPSDDELDNSISDASYKIIKRSGFIDSDKYSENEQKKKDVYLFSAGSCFKNEFVGQIVDVSNGGHHPVYRYAKPFFMGVDV